MINDFPSRQEILAKKHTSSYKEQLIEQAKQINVDKIDFESSDFKPRNKIIEKQKIYRWTRLFIKDTLSDIQVNDTIVITHVPTGEKLESVFICFAKKNLEKDSDGNIVAFEGEEDKKVLCLMIDTEKLEDDNLKFIRSLFQNTKWYEYQLLKRTDLLFVNQRTAEAIDYFDVTF